MVQPRENQKMPTNMTVTVTDLLSVQRRSRITIRLFYLARAGCRLTTGKSNMLIKLRPFGMLVKEGAEIFTAYLPGGKLV
jgi:hypothetical protein